MAVAYRVFRSGANSNLWRPQPGNLDTGVVAVLLGRTSWLESAPSVTPRQLVNRGCWALAANNDDINAALAQMATVTTQATNRLLIISHGAAASDTAVEWAIDNHQRVAGMLLLNPSYSLTANRTYEKRDRLNDRITELTVPDPLLVKLSVLDEAAAAAAAWDNEPGALMTREWIRYTTNNTLTADVAGADGCFTQSIPPGVANALPNGGAIWSGGDFFNGTVNADGTRTGQGIINNYLLLEDNLGDLVATTHEVGTTGASIIPANVNNFFWLSNALVENGVVYVLASEREPDGGFGIPIANVIIQLGADLKKVAVRSVPIGITPSFANMEHGGDGFTYIFAKRSHEGNAFDGRPFLLRIPAGQIMTGAIQYWAGETRGALPAGGPWVSNEALASQLTTNGVPILSPGGAWKMPSGKWVLTGKPNTFSKEPFKLHVANGPAGPWKYFRSFAPPELDAERHGGTTLAYILNYHAHLSTPTKAVFGYSVNWNDSTPPSGNNGNAMDASIYRPRFVTFPSP